MAKSSWWRVAGALAAGVLVAGCELNLEPPRSDSNASQPAKQKVSSSSCEYTLECIRSQICYRGFCTDTPCRSDSECASGMQCLHMVCHAECGSDVDCHEGEFCSKGVCYETGQQPSGGCGTCG